MNKLSPQNIFILISIIFGLAFLVITPPFQVFDESDHFCKAIYLSEGKVIPKLNSNDTIYHVPLSASESIRTFQYLPLHPERKVNMSDIYSLLKIDYDEKTKVPVDLAGKSIIQYSPVPYLASATIILILKIFNISPLFLLYFGRLANLFLWIFLVYLAIKITPVHKWVFFMLALMPMTLFQGASLSADSFTIAISFLLIAYFLKLAFDNKSIISKRELLILFLILALLGLSKSFYSLLILLFFIIPSYKFINWKKKFLNFTYLFLGLSLIIFTWNFMVRNLYVPYNPNASISSQVVFILSNPLVFIDIFINTLTLNFQQYISLFVGNLAWGDTPLPLSLVY